MKHFEEPKNDPEYDLIKGQLMMLNAAERMLYARLEVKYPTCDDEYWTIYGTQLIVKSRDW
jgi:hypothetical protein